MENASRPALPTVYNALGRYPESPYLHCRAGKGSLTETHPRWQFRIKVIPLNPERIFGALRSNWHRTDKWACQPQAPINIYLRALMLREQQLEADTHLRSSLNNKEPSTSNCRFDDTPYFDHDVQEYRLWPRQM